MLSALIHGMGLAEAHQRKDPQDDILISQEKPEIGLNHPLSPRGRNSNFAIVKNPKFHGVRPVMDRVFGKVLNAYSNVLGHMLGNVNDYTYDYEQ